MTAPLTVKTHCWGFLMLPNSTASRATLVRFPNPLTYLRSQAGTPPCLTETTILSFGKTLFSAAKPNAAAAGTLQYDVLV